MAASANPVGNNNNQEGSSAAQKSTANGVSVNSSNNGVPMRVSVRLLPHAHNLDFSEKILLVSRLWYASDSAVNRYAKIAKQLKDKTVRDVALRCRWMTKKENGKRRKEDHNSARKNKDRKEKATDSSAKSSSHLAARPNGPSYAPPMIPMDTDDGISYRAIGGITGDILEQNAQMFNQISANFGTFQIRDNIDLLCKARENILSIMNEYVITSVLYNFFINESSTLPWSKIFGVWLILQKCLRYVECCCGEFHGEASSCVPVSTILTHSLGAKVRFWRSIEVAAIPASTRAL
ncbi:Histone H2A deubiquitinase (DUF3755) [Citrus sinensis]|uniref:Histone H2A deubiquitinase (DUF3755) n=1 Tax=Citrus sinensis TaxID=2711 RepID=A0ACB8N807_CITSI|nr:Histone H2A deubiquitinase (DUF3755) [Citrus sinensis]